MRILFKLGKTMLAGLLLIMAGIWSTAGPAWAGGPTSVLMVDPTSGNAAALHTSNPRYQQLVDAIGAYDAPAGPTAPPTSVPADCFGCEIRLTWLIHDMSVWRIDRVFLTTNDGIWVGTVSNSEGGDIYNKAAHWQRPHDPKALLALLRSSGVVSTNGSATSTPVTSTPAASTAEQATASGGGGPGAPLGLVALGSGIVGVVVGLIGSRLIRRRSEHDRVVLTG